MCTQVYTFCFVYYRFFLKEFFTHVELSLALSVCATNFDWCLALADVAVKVLNCENVYRYMLYNLFYVHSRSFHSYEESPLVTTRPTNLFVPKNMTGRSARTPPSAWKKGGNLHGLVTPLSTTAHSRQFYRKPWKMAADDRRKTGNSRKEGTRMDKPHSDQIGRRQRRLALRGLQVVRHVSPTTIGLGNEMMRIMHLKWNTSFYRVRHFKRTFVDHDHLLLLLRDSKWPESK